MLVSMVTVRYSYALLPVFILLSCNFKNGLRLFKNKSHFLFRFNFVIIIIFISHLLFNLELLYKRINEKNYLPISSKAIDTKKSVNLLKVYEQVINEVKNKKKILAYEAVWLYAFSNIEREKIFSTNNLPPFEDKTDKTNLFLDKFDTILVSNQFKNQRSGMASSINLRYRLHIKNYLKKNINNFSISKIDGYGFIYHRN